MRDREIEDELSGGGFLDDPRLRDAYLSKTPRERREMAKFFHEMNLIGTRKTRKEKQELYDRFFEREQYGEAFEGCGGCLAAVLMVVGILYAWLKG